MLTPNGEVCFVDRNTRTTTRDDTTPGSQDTDTSCLMCCIRPKNSRFDFCGLACLLDARKLAPLLLAIPRDHVTFTMGTFVQAAFSRAITTVYSSQEQVPTSLESWLVPQHQKCVQSCGKLCLNRCIFCIST